MANVYHTTTVVLPQEVSGSNGAQLSAHGRACGMACVPAQQAIGRYWPDGAAQLRPQLAALKFQLNNAHIEALAICSALCVTQWAAFAAQKPTFAWALEPKPKPE